MPFKIAYGIVAVALLAGFIGPVVVKLKDPALIVVALIGLTMTVTDLWHTIRSKED